MINIKRISIVALILLVVGTIGSYLTFRENYRTATVLKEKVINKSVTAININTDNTGIEIIPTKGTTTKVRVYGRKTPDIKQTFSANLEEKALSIQLKEHQVKLFNFDFFPVSFLLKVYVPEKQYESLQINNDNGQVKIGRLNVKNLKAKTNNGEMEFNHINAINVDFRTDNGAIRYLGQITGKVTGKTDNGKISFVTPNIDYPIQLRSDNGSITIHTDNEPTNVTYDVHVDNGSINIFNKYTSSSVIGKGDNMIKLTTNNGKISITK
ncbi:DUF4097 family beta strand repeat-containing protein [Neobacillus sp. PS3-40]|uniref:DUF4097 family beta strand repeat-containing protein n=1 Tax=Neobacillus sp. PS3-40 TaxID=3070679 RepID=UPI0027E1D5B0|nr:DUF4097 family beta strand repeat-containing protein [Neobacillus sp. PS3-40]WML42857.1 DUF4097 family beta strand repeat-containing protein [Neobacillus sp. PS3-40]